MVEQLVMLQFIKVIEKHKLELGTVQNILAGCLSHANQEIEECDLKMENVRRECDLRTKEARKKIAFLQGPVKGFSDAISELALASQRTAANCMTPPSVRVDRPPLAPTISPARPAQQFTSTLRCVHAHAHDHDHDHARVQKCPKHAN